jgi:hypothetical protein
MEVGGSAAPLLQFACVLLVFATQTLNYLSLLAFCSFIALTMSFRHTHTHTHTHDCEGRTTGGKEDDGGEGEKLKT